MNYDSTKVYFTDKIQHCIIEYELQTRNSDAIAGKCSKSGTYSIFITGNKLGDA